MLYYRRCFTEFLQEKLNEETSAEAFSVLPFRFAEISKVLLDMCVSSFLLLSWCMTMIHSASDDLVNPDKLRSSLKDLREARQAKSREGLRALDHVQLSVRAASGWSGGCV